MHLRIEVFFVLVLDENSMNEPVFNQERLDIVSFSIEHVAGLYRMTKTLGVMDR